MRLKQIKLAGFKSFVDATLITLPGNRCAVVGPNGCGKSNIIDAVRWVMGESSAKQLRGENLTDVIFNGSNSRKPTSAASIELIFDNTDGRIGGEYAAYAEIAIRRQATRDGQSEYFLNGSKCRRRDIQDIFLGTGFGPRSYSIIEQGMISQLIEAKPEDLRVYLEEAAGISRYKERRRETETRIKHARENLERINDIREELARQLDRLQRQAKAAERYRELRTEESLLTAQLYALRHSELKAELTNCEGKITDLELALEKCVAEQRNLEAQIEQSRAIHADQSEEFNSIQGSFYQLGADVARIEEAILFNETRVKQLETDLASVNQRKAESERQLQMDETQIAQLGTDIGNLEPELVVLAEKDRAAQDLLEQSEVELRAWQEQWDAFNHKVSANEREAEVQVSRIEHLEQLLQRLRGRQQKLQHLQSEQRETGEETVGMLAEEIDQLEVKSRLHNLRIDECLKELAAAREDVLLREQVLDDARNEVQGLRHELAALQAVQEAALGQHVQEAEAWLAREGLEHQTRLGDSLAVVPGWELAVEAVLGEFLSAIRVDDLNDFASSLAELPDGNLSLIERAPALEAPLNNKLKLPTLKSMIHSDANSAGSILFSVYAADNATVALAKRDLLSLGESIITREGFWVGPDWIRVLHGNFETSGIIERGQEIETLNVRVEEAERTLAELQLDAQEGRSRIERVEVEREELQQHLSSLSDNLAQLRTDHGVTRVKVEEAGVRREQLAVEDRDIAEQVDRETEQLQKARTGLVQIEQRREGESDERDEITNAKTALEENLRKAREEARGSRDRYHEVNVQSQSLASRLAASETARDRLIAQRESLDEQQLSLNAGIEASRTPLPELQAELKKKLATRVTVEGQLQTIRDDMEQQETATRALEDARHTKEAEVSDLRSQLEDVRVERQGLSVQEANLLEQLTATGHELAAIEQNVPDNASIDEWTEELERMARRIQRLGPINLAAIDEFEQENERKHYLDAQADDLDKALETLLEAIHKIDKDTRTRFKETFDAVNSRLGELFPKVFGGGHAYLELTGEDLLDAGVSLMARPPGKRNTSVHLLSGGEKAMTAVALIFAIFHLNPSPVCLLDEVDAPLDDANVSRFASLIEEMSADVQFLVVTHNKITMEMADFLMGVTMQEAGVSRLVSVDVDEATAMAAS